MSFFNTQQDTQDMHPEDIESSLFALPEGDTFSETTHVLNPSAEQNAFDAIHDAFGMEDLDHWWEKE